MPEECRRLPRYPAGIRLRTVALGTRATVYSNQSFRFTAIKFDRKNTNSATCRTCTWRHCCGLRAPSPGPNRSVPRDGRFATDPQGLSRSGPAHFPTASRSKHTQEPTKTQSTFRPFTFYPNNPNKCCDIIWAEGYTIAQ